MGDVVELNDRHELHNTAKIVLEIMAELSAMKAKPGDAGERECPRCKGKLHWRVDPAGRRGLGMRIWCETPNCVSAMS